MEDVGQISEKEGLEFEWMNEHETVEYQPTSNANNVLDVLYREIDTDISQIVTRHEICIWNTL